MTEGDFCFSFAGLRTNRSVDRASDQPTEIFEDPNGPVCSVMQANAKHTTLVRTGGREAPINRPTVRLMSIETAEAVS